MINVSTITIIPIFVKKYKLFKKLKRRLRRQIYAKEAIFLRIENWRDFCALLDSNTVHPAHNLVNILAEGKTYNQIRHSLRTNRLLLLHCNFSTWHI
jgi:hypothetical protein